MRTILLFLCNFLFFSNFSLAQDYGLIDQDNHEIQLCKGPVKSMLQKSQQRHSDDPELPYYFGQHSFQLVNKHRRIIESKGWKEDGSLRYHGNFYYDETDSVFIRMERIFPTNQTNPTAHLLGVYYWSSPTLMLRVDTVENRIISRMTYTKEGVRSELKIFGDDTNTVVRVDNYDAYGSRVRNESWEYDMHYTRTWTYKYDGNGNVLEKMKPNALGNVYRMLYTYDSLNRKVTYKYIDGGSDYTSDEFFSYNTHGDMVKKEKITSTGELDAILTWDYSYDALGNWTKKNRLKNGKIVREASREITYYD